MTLPDNSPCGCEHGKEEANVTPNLIQQERKFDQKTQQVGCPIGVAHFHSRMLRAEFFVLLPLFLV